MFIHDCYEKIAVEAIKNHIYEYDEDLLKEVAYNATDFNSRIFVFSYNDDIKHLYVVTVYPNKSIDIEIYLHECGYSI